MSNRKPKGTQIDTISRYAPQVQESFDLNRLDAFVNSLGIDYIHYRAMPSPIGKNDRGDLRRNDGVDTISSNGMLYRKAGVFTGAMTDNSREIKRGLSGPLDPSEGRLVMPRFYNKPGTRDQDTGCRIYLMPGDRLYIADPKADTFVANAHEMDYEEGVDNVAMFPIASLQDPIIDSRNIQYIQGVDFIITSFGDIRWLPGGRTPGIDPETKKGRIYSIRYLYKAFYYITMLPKEVRVTNVTTGGVRAPERMPYYAQVVREYIFHQKNRGDTTQTPPGTADLRKDAAPRQSINPNQFEISVDNIDVHGNDDDEQS